MRVILSGRAVTLDDDDLLGAGGEARVFRAAGFAVKVFHAPDAAKAAKLRAFPAGLPPFVVAPEALVHDERGRVVGYAMRLVEGARPAAALADPRSRATGVDAAAVCRIFARLAEALAALHARGVVVGDLNDGNVLVDPGAPDPRLHLIDADSMQVPGHLCTVAHERFLDPRLYGADLTAAPRFDEGTDGFSLRVMLFQSLTFVHPFGGVHPAHKTLLRRAEARVSVLKDGVRLPKCALPWSALPDDLLHDLAAAFHDDARRPLDPRLLPSTWTRCACGLEHARGACPACRRVDPLRTRDRVRRLGRVVERRAFSTTGTILACSADGGLSYAWDDGGVVRREDGSVVLEGARAPGVRVFLAGRSTWIGRGEDLVRVEAGAVRERASTSTFEGEPAFAAAPGNAWRVEAGALVQHQTGRRLGRVLVGQTWLAAGPSFGVGLWRAGALVFPFVFSPRLPSLRDVALPIPRGRIVDLAACFDDHAALLGVAVEKDGRRTHALFLVDESGRLLGQRAGAPDSTPLLQSVGGKCLRGGRVLSSSDEGLVLARPDPATGLLVEEAPIADTASFVDSSTSILPGSGGAVWVVAPKEITELRLSA